MDSSLDKNERAARAMFSRWSRWYDGAISRLYFEPLYRRITLWVEDQKDKLAGARALDVACGTGEIIYRLAREFPAAEFIGVDFSPAMTEKAAEKNSGLSNARFQTADVKNLPFSENSFDFVICSEALHHFFYPDKAIREICRVLKPNGKLLLVDPAFNSSLLKFFGLIFKKFENAHAYYSAEELKRLLDAANFVVESSFKRHFNNFVIARKP